MLLVMTQALELNPAAKMVFEPSQSQCSVRLNYQEILTSADLPVHNNTDCEDTFRLYCLHMHRLTMKTDL